MSHTICRACSSTDLRPFCDLGTQPASNDYRTDNFGQPQYPLNMLVCGKCGLGQLDVIVDPVEIFGKEYFYFSSTSPTWVEDRRHLANRMINEFGLDEASLVVDIGSNDGYYLRHFAERNISVLGYEPAPNVAEVARQNGVATHTEFWSASVHARAADLVNATNVLAHTPDMDGFIAGVAASLLTDGVATLEFPRFSNMIRNNQLDTIYHEHYSYISVHALQIVLERHGLRIWRIEELATHGGSVRVFASRKKARYIEEESVSRVASSEVWAPDIDFEKKACKVKWDLLVNLNAAPKPIIGYGAPAKATVLCNYAGLGTDIIDFMVDDSPAKQGKFIPGTNIPIDPFERLAFDYPATIVVFPWNLLAPITAKLKKFYNDSGLRGPAIVTAIPYLTVTKI